MVSLAVKRALHPASQSWPMETRVSLSLGNILTWVASGGRAGMGRFPVCVDWMVVPSGSVTWIGLESA